MRILIAEDDATSKTVLSGLLNRFGHEVIETVNGAEALEILMQKDYPKLAILDWMMPEIDGLEVVKQIRSIPLSNPTYIIMLTAKTDRNDIISALDAGADDYLTKPFDAGELRSRIEVGIRMIDLQTRLQKKIRELKQAIEDIKTLKGIVPICSSCKKIRDDDGFWQRVEDYVREHSEAEFSHSICPDCMGRLYPEYKDEIE